MSNYNFISFFAAYLCWYPCLKSLYCFFIKVRVFLSSLPIFVPFHIGAFNETISFILGYNIIAHTVKIKKEDPYFFKIKSKEASRIVYIFKPSISEVILLFMISVPWLGKKVGYEDHKVELNRNADITLTSEEVPGKIVSSSPQVPQRNIGTL